MGGLDEKQGGSHFMVDLTPRKVSAGTFSPRFDSPKFRIPLHLRTGLHTLKHTLGQGDRWKGFVDRLRLQVSASRASRDLAFWMKPRIARCGPCRFVKVEGLPIKLTSASYSPIGLHSARIARSLPLQSIAISDKESSQAFPAQDHMHGQSQLVQGFFYAQ